MSQKGLGFRVSGVEDEFEVSGVPKFFLFAVVAPFLLTVAHRKVPRFRVYRFQDSKWFRVFNIQVGL